MEEAKGRDRVGLLTAQEAEYLALDEVTVISKFPTTLHAEVSQLVDINPTFSSSGREIELLTVCSFISCSLSLQTVTQGKIGPFTPQLKLSVPLWAAQKLAHIGKCKVIPPAWLTVGMNVLVPFVLLYPLSDVF